MGVVGRGGAFVGAALCGRPAVVLLSGAAWANAQVKSRAATQGCPDERQHRDENFLDRLVPADIILMIGLSLEGQECEHGRLQYEAGRSNHRGR